jgi:hypothetical protein
VSRILVPPGGNWYDALNAVGFYGEADIERWILQHVRTLFADHYVFPFKKDIQSKATAMLSRPDLAMIRKDFARWGIIEVELERHQLQHVLDQTRVFLDGDYNAAEIAKYVKQQVTKYCRKRVSLKRLRKLLNDDLPQVLVIVESLPAGWEEQLNRAGVDVCVFEVYKNPRGQHIYRACGKYPVIRTEEAHLRRSALPNLFEVIGNFAFKNLRKNNEVHVYYGDGLTRWSVINNAGRRYLRFIGKLNPLSPNATYCLFGDKRSRYYLQEN